MHFSVLTLFPELMNQIMNESIIGRALRAGHIQYESVDIRDFAMNDYGKVDDSLYGGGRGMLMMCEPIFQAWEHVVHQVHRTASPIQRQTIYMSPRGRVLDQNLVKSLARYDHLIFICGHYEGVDQRVLDELDVLELSIGDYVLTGGELPAAVAMDAIARMIPGVLPDRDAFEYESHFGATLECDQYTKPSSWHDRVVPSVLQSGHHEKIGRYHFLDGLKNTWLKRLDLFADQSLDEQTCIDLIRHIHKEQS